MPLTRVGELLTRDGEPVFLYRRLLLIVLLSNAVFAAAVLLLWGRPWDWRAQVPAIFVLLALAAYWIRWHTTPTDFPPVGDLLEAVGLFILARAAADPTQMMAVFFTALYFHSIYGQPLRAVLRAGIYLLALLGAAVVAPSNVDPSLFYPRVALLVVPGFAIAVFVMQALLRSTRRHAEMMAADRILRNTSSELLGARDLASIYSVVIRGVEALLPSGARSQVIAADLSAGQLAVVGSTGLCSPQSTAPTALVDALMQAASEAEDTGSRELDADGLAELVIALGCPAEFRPQAGMVVPLFVESRPQGMLFVCAEAPLPARFVEAVGAVASDACLALERAVLAEKVGAREGRFRSLVQNASEVVSLLDEDGRIVYESPSIHRVLGYQPDERSGALGIEDVHPDDRPIVRRAFSDVSATIGKVSSLQARVQHANGSWRWIEASLANHLDDPNVKGIVVNYRDVTERKTLEEQLTHQAFHDPLTKLANRLLFRERVLQAVARTDRHPEQIAVLFLDLDDFKAVNDTLGHPAGDRLLVTVAERIRACLRSADTAARFGGDEFAILLEDLRGPADAIRVAERIVQSLNTPLNLQGREVTARGSVGVVVREPGGAGADELLRNADIAMYAAKSRGKARYELFVPEMQVTLMGRTELTDELPGAPERA